MVALLVYLPDLHGICYLVLVRRPLATVFHTVESRKAESMCVAEGCPFSSVEVDVLLLRLCPHMVDILLLHARLHHYTRVPVFPFQASAVLRHRRAGKPAFGQNLCRHAKPD